MINFMRLKKLYFFLSACVIVPGLISLALFGLKPSIDFTGGTQWTLHIVTKDSQPLTIDGVKSVIGNTIEINNESTVNADKVFLKAKPTDAKQRTDALAKLKAAYTQVDELQYEVVGPVLGQELIYKTLVALLISAGGITLYIAYRFKDLKYGASATLATLHDSLVLVGIFSLLGHFKGIEVDTLFVTALLTILSFSVHDTIVVYDRIRELRAKNKTEPYVDIVNRAITQTLSRSINNSMMIIVMLLALYLLGGDTIRYFVLALLIGTVTGTYSSVFVAAPILVIWDEVVKKKK
ncbi:MAG TPA: protein translocase subunit SecF [Candidatus Saccharimonadia bacterium]|nr:protein translocase subunit SecF [Candidatus Saccharimonadia bacterium]